MLELPTYSLTDSKASYSASARKDGASFSAFSHHSIRFLQHPLLHQRSHNTLRSVNARAKSPQWNARVPAAPFQYPRTRSPIQQYLSMPSQHEANSVLSAMLPPYIADRAKLSCIREVAGYVTCNMSTAIRRYWFSDSCCVGLGIFCSLLWECSVLSGNVKTPMSQWKESP